MKTAYPSKILKLFGNQGFPIWSSLEILKLSFFWIHTNSSWMRKVDFIVLGTHREELIPLFTEIRKSATVFALIDDVSSVSKAFEESFDGIIEVSKIEEFSFNSTQFSELDQIIQQANGQTHSNPDPLVSDYTGTPDEVVDDSNIGTFSEDYIEDDSMIEDMKKGNERKRKGIILWLSISFVDSRHNNLP